MNKEIILGKFVNGSIKSLVNKKNTKSNNEFVITIKNYNGEETIKFVDEANFKINEISLQKNMK